MIIVVYNWILIFHYGCGILGAKAAKAPAIDKAASTATKATAAAPKFNPPHNAHAPQAPQPPHTPHTEQLAPRAAFIGSGIIVVPRLPKSKTQLYPYCLSTIYF